MNIERPILLKPNNLYFDIYKYIWLGTREKRIFTPKIADTVLFLDDMPILWIFTGKDGSVKRKNPKKLNTSYIKNHFLNKNNEIIGHYMYSSEENRLITFIAFNDDENIENTNLINDYFEKLDINLEDRKFEKSKLNFDILDRDKFINLITYKKKRCGVLQSYVQSNNSTSFMYRIVWTPNFCVCDMRNARHQLNKNVHLFEKVITFETDKLHLETSIFK